MPVFQRAVILVFCLIVSASGPAAQTSSVGWARLSTDGNETGRILSLSLWYPAEAGPTREVAGNAVLRGVEAVPDARPLDGLFPMILLSHGGMRSADDSGAWLSAALAASGFLVVDVNAPRVRSARDGLDETWRRADDLRHAREHVLAMPSWRDRIDPQRVFAVGAALGGTAALVLAGARIDPAVLARACDHGDSADCDWFSQAGVTLDMIDAENLTAPRVMRDLAGAVAIAPEYVDAMTGLPGDVSRPARIVILDDDSERASAPGGAAGRQGTGAVMFSTLRGVDAFDIFSVCTAKAPRILEADGGDPGLCAGSALERRAAHRAILSEVQDQLGRLR